MAKIKWTNRAKQEYYSAISFGHLIWGIKAIGKLRSAVNEYSGLLRRFPMLGSIEPLLKERSLLYRSIVVHKHYKMIYMVKDDIVYVVDFWDVRKEPNSLTNRL